MLGWLRRLLGGGEPPKAAPTLDELLALDQALTHAEADHLAAALTRLTHDGVESDACQQVQERLDAWLGTHPFEIRWEREWDFQVVDPLGITTDHLAPDPESPTLVAWAPWMRSLVMVSGGANSFHHGWMADDVLRILEDARVPEVVEHLDLPHFDAGSPREVTKVIERIAEHPSLADLRHLSLQGVSGLTAGHLRTLASADWAAGLSTLDLTERLMDMEPADKRASLECLGSFSGLTHLILYNDVGDPDDLAALLSRPFPELRVLDLGHGPADAAALRLLLETTALPRLEDARGMGGPPYDDEIWRRAVAAPFRVYRGSTLVTEMQLESFARNRRARDEGAPPVPEHLASAPADAVAHPGGTSSKVMHEGAGGAHPTLDSQVALRYAGWSSDGTLFDSNYHQAQPMTVKLRHTDPAWHEVVRQMVSGEIRLAWAPAKDPPRPGYPAGALVYQLELVASD